jgi:hypothetical protein
MMARYRRMRVATLILRINFAPTFFCMAIFLTLHKPTRALLAYVRKRKFEELDELDMALVTLRRRAIDLEREMQQAHQLSEDRQDELLAACSEVSAETNACRASVVTVPIVNALTSRRHISGSHGQSEAEHPGTPCIALAPRRAE